MSRISENLPVACEVNGCSPVCGAGDDKVGASAYSIVSWVPGGCLFAGAAAPAEGEEEAGLLLSVEATV